MVHENAMPVMEGRGRRTMDSKAPEGSDDESRMPSGRVESNGVWKEGTGESPPLLRPCRERITTRGFSLLSLPGLCAVLSVQEREESGGRRNEVGSFLTARADGV